MFIYKQFIVKTRPLFLKLKSNIKILRNFYITANKMDSSEDRKVVLLTGFGPFPKVSMNTSWEAVKCLIKNKEELERELNISLITEEIPVEYKYVHENIPKLWNQHKPHLSIHAGVSNIATGFTLEKFARKHPYYILDAANYRPGHNPLGTLPYIGTDLEVNQISEEFNASAEVAFKADVSYDAGNYVCEYLYYTVLCLQEQNRSSLFVHVPFREEEEEISKLARGLERLLRICVEHKRQHDNLIP